MLLIYLLLISSEAIKVKTYTTNQDVIIHFNVPNFESKVKLVGGQEFVELYLSDAGISSDVGKPSLPVIRKFIEVPDGAELSIETQIGPVQEFTLNYPVYPTQPPVPKIPGYTPIFTLDKSSYMVDSFSPSTLARIASIFELRGRRAAVVEVYPVQYNPVQNKVRFVTDIKVTILFSNADWGTTLANLSHYYTPYYESRYHLIENYDYFNSVKLPTLPIGYLIITPDSWYNSIFPLADWKAQKGYSVSIAKLSEIGGRDTTAVRNYIKNAYNSWPIPPTFVLLVGDVDSIGYFVGSAVNNPPTDLYYSTMTDSDYFPDLDVTRFSVSTQFELDSLVSKTIKYEQCDWSSGTDWCNRMYFIASADGGNHQIAESTHQYSMQVARSHNVLCDSLWLFYNSGTPITDALNNGRSWVMYSGHGSTSGWETGFSVSNVQGLTNVDKPAFVGTFACYCGHYPTFDCFSESWARSGYRGGIASFASSVTSYWDEDDILQRRMFDAAFDSGFTSVMGMLNKGKLLLFAYYGATPIVQRYFEMYNLMGDGSIDAYRDVPHTITVDYPPAIPVGAFSLEITVKDGTIPVDGALVCAKEVRPQNDSIFTGYTNSAGVATLNLLTTKSCTLLITVTGLNLAPFFGNCYVINEGRYVLCKSYTIDDSAGNNDGCVNPGEQIKLPVVLWNIGTESVYGVKGTLSTTDPYISLETTLQNYGTILPNDTAVSDSGYQFTISPTTPERHMIPFGMQIEDDSQNLWLDSIFIIVGGPQIVYEQYKIIDTASANPNEFWEAGEIAEFGVTLKNIGAGNAANVESKLITTDPLVTIFDSVSSFGNIPSGISKIGELYKVSLNPSAPYGHLVNFSLYISSGPYNWEDSFIVETGLPCVMYADHNVGNVKFTVTAQGICGFISPNGSGSGFCYPNPGTNWLYIGSLWVGNSKDYVVNRDTDTDSDWIVTTTPDGRLRLGSIYFSDQDGWAMYSDAGHPTPKGITVTQRSWTWRNTPYNDFVILQYLVKNESPNTISGLYVGQFMDFDIDGSSSNDNIVGTDSMRNFVYQWSNSHNEYIGVTLLAPQHAANLSAINISDLQGDSIRLKFLNGNSHFPNSDTMRDWGIIASAGPFDLTPYEQVVCAFAIIAGDSLIDALHNSDMAQELYNSITEIEETSIISSSLIFTVHPNPFTRNITIEFGHLPFQPVRLKIYDLAGRVVKEFPIPITDNRIPITKIVWDGKDKYNRSVPSGVYFCNISSANKYKIKKLILIK